MERIQKDTLQQLRKWCRGADLLSEETLNWIGKENLWNLWVPKEYGGKGFSFSRGLKILKELAQVDGSLGWTVTLVSGANYFVGNLLPEKAKQIFKGNTLPIFGGSGGVFGTAEKKGDIYLLNGIWKYATGAPYLTHFTLNAKITENGQPILENGKEVIRSFVVPAEKVLIIDDWHMMGLQGTATCSFKVQNLKAEEGDSFVYNRFYLEDPIFKISFKLFADLTLWVNYLGMALHYLEESEKGEKPVPNEALRDLLQQLEELTFEKAAEVEDFLSENQPITADFENELHQVLSEKLVQLTDALIGLHPYLGMRAARGSEYLSVIFKDYFTATQHHNFVDR